MGTNEKTLDTDTNYDWVHGESGAGESISQITVILDTNVFTIY